MHDADGARRIAMAAVTLALLTAAPAAAQSGAPVARASTASASVTAAAEPVRLALLDLAFYGKRANSIEPGDTLMGHEGTVGVRAFFEKSGAVALPDSATVAAAAASPEAVAAAAGRPCNVVMACARAVGQKLGVPWVVTGKVSKTSNLIWIFSGQLIDVATGELVMDDEYELKGDPHDMVAAGSRVFARRVVRKIGPQPKA